jgi:hypothetical protein
MIEAANVTVDLSGRRSLTLDELQRLQEPAVIFEYEGRDSDNVPHYVYTVAGWLDGRNVATMQGGCLVGGDAIVIHADTREHADFLAGDGLATTLSALDSENERYLEAEAALARLATVGAVDRVNLATKPDADKSDAFVSDVNLIRPLIGDDIILATGSKA